MWVRAGNLYYRTKARDDQRLGVQGGQGRSAEKLVLNGFMYGALIIGAIVCGLAVIGVRSLL